MKLWRAGLVVLLSLVWLFPVLDGAWTASADADVTPPTAVSATVAPTTVVAGGTVDVRVRITDSESGASGALLTALPVSGSGTAIGFAILESGTPSDGIWLARLQISASAHPGPWRAYISSISDNAANTRYISPPDPLASGLEFTVTGGSTDTTPPTLVSASVAPATVAVGGTVEVRLRITDSESGASGALLTAVPVSGSGTAISFAILESGTPADGIWLARLQISAFARLGTWRAYVSSVSDNAGNTRYISPPDPLASGLGFTVTDSSGATPTFTPAPTSTITPTPTTTPTVITSACAPRPAVGVRTSRTGDGRMLVTVTAGLGSVQAVQFGTDTRPLANASVDVQGGSTGMRAGFTQTPTAGTGQVTFYVRPVVAGQPVTVPLTVIDGCGEWQTLVGGGAGAF